MDVCTSPRTFITDTARRAQTHCSELLISNDMNKKPWRALEYLSLLKAEKEQLSKDYKKYVIEI